MFMRDTDTLYLDFITSIVLNKETIEVPGKNGKTKTKKTATITYASGATVEVVAHGAEYKRAMETRRHEQETAANGVTLAYVVERPKSTELSCV